MTATTADIRSALQTMLENAYSASWQTNAYVLANSSAPFIDVMPGPIVYDRAMARGVDDARYIVRACVPMGSDASAQQNLDQLLDLDPASTTSMKNAIETLDAEGNPTLGGVVQWARVVEASEYKTYNQGGTELLGVEWTVEVVP